MVGYDEEWKLLSAIAQQALLMALAEGDEVGHRRTLVIIGKVLSQTGGVDLDLA